MPLLLWIQKRRAQPFPYRSDTPAEIVEIFEKHGFIWGGRWFHYDTMHFEYRPEADISIVANNSDNFYNDRSNLVDRDNDGVDDRAEGAGTEAA